MAVGRGWLRENSVVFGISSEFSPIQLLQNVELLSPATRSGLPNSHESAMLLAVSDSRNHVRDQLREPLSALCRDSQNLLDVDRFQRVGQAHVCDD